MNARTCQLCGKPLSRFAVGSGGDFCSREHRNQYRLRLGMDRLMEANKVASLMRRRENAKQISAEFLLADYDIAPRSYPPARIPVQNPSMDGFKPTPPLLFVPRVPKRSDQAAKLRHVKVALAAEPRPLPLAMSSGRGTVPPPSRSHKLTVEIPRSRPAIVRDRIVKPDGDPREFGILRHPPLRVHIGSEHHKRYSIPPVGAHSLKSSPRTHTLRNYPVKGQELRVSASAGFRLPEPVRPAVEFGKPDPVAMPFSTRPHGVAPPAHTIEAGTRHAVKRITKSKMAYRPPAMGTGGVAFLWPGAVRSGACDLRDADGVVRCSTLRWNTGDPLTPGLRPPEDGVGFRHSSASVIASRPGAAGMNSTQRLTVVAFEPQDSAFEYTPRALHGSLMGGVPFGAAPTAKQKTASAEPAAVPALEEHFANGWTNWLGGVQDWKLDIAGVRTGTLALFGPSIELDDYDLEFLARIDQHSINWVYRAHDFNEYYEGSIAMAAGGGFTFSRATVAGGERSSASTLPISPPSTLTASPGGKTALTVRMRLRGSEFTLYLDGRTVDTWTDARFPVGGIGFFGTPDDRARLYWVRLTPAGIPTKENRTQ